MTAFEFLGGRAHCGRPWHPYGAPYALVDCPDHQVGNGCGAVLENALFGNPVRCHDPVGWPTFKDWPHHESLTHEQTYYKWLERAHMGGLRLFVNLFVENRALCELYPLKGNNCDEMASVRLQNRDLDALQDYIDAQNGGPGRGWFRIVKNPFEARRVIAAGKLAVVKGIEVSEPFGCRVYNDEPQCDRAKIDRELDEVHGFGVRQMELINKFDNALAGVAGDSGQTGVVVNGGNRLATGHFWRMQHCTGPPDEHDKQQPGVYDHDENDMLSNVIEQFLPLGVAPVYPSDSNCNALGLSDLGDHAVRRLMQKKMIIDPDHLSVRARKSVMDLIEAARYSGAISSHSWSTADVIPRIYKVGGVVTPMKESAEEWIKTWRTTKAQRDPRFYFGMGYGSDQNGLSSQPHPREGPNPVEYPFKSFDGRVTFQRQRSGEREFDITKDGVAHYGLFPDWWEDIRRVGGAAAVKDMARGAEAYLQSWERVNGIPFGCKSPRQRFASRGTRRILLRNTTAQLLRRGGQPRVRGDRSWSWCVRGKQNRRKRVAAALTPKGTVALVGSNANGSDLRRLRVGDPAGRLRGKARKLGKDLYVRGAGRRARFVYGVRGGQHPLRCGGHARGVEEPHGAAPLPGVGQASLSRARLHEPRDLDAQLVQHQQRHHLEQERHGVERRQQRREHRDRNDRVAPAAPQLVHAHDAEPGQGHDPNRHLEPEAHREHQHGGEVVVVARTDLRVELRGVEAQEKVERRGEHDEVAEDDPADEEHRHHEDQRRHEPSLPRIERRRHERVRLVQHDRQDKDHGRVAGALQGRDERL